MLLEQVILMSTTFSAGPATTPHAAAQSQHARVLSLLAALWLILFFASLFAPPVLDDADGTHANAARQMAFSGDWVTLRVNNVRYLEKAPLPYWIVAVSLRLFGVNAFAVHLPQALCVLLLMLLGVRWARQAFGNAPPSTPASASSPPPESSSSPESSSPTYSSPSSSPPPSTASSNPSLPPTLNACHPERSAKR